MLSHLTLSAVSKKDVGVRRDICTRRGKAISQLADRRLPSRIARRVHLIPPIVNTPHLHIAC
jgi:hypothetical protein